MILAIPYLVVYIQRFWITSERAQHSWKEKLNALAPLILIPAGVLVYMIYLGHATGNPLMFISQEGTFHWHRHLNFPWVGIVAAFSTVFATTNFDNVKIQNLLDLTFTLIPLITLILFSSENVLSPIGSDRELPSLRHRLEFDLIAHAFESLHQAFLHSLSVPLIEIIAT